MGFVRVPDLADTAVAGVVGMDALDGVEMDPVAASLLEARVPAMLW